MEGEAHSTFGHQVKADYGRYMKQFMFCMLMIGV